MKKINFLTFVFIVILGLGEIIILSLGLSVWPLIYWWVLLFVIWLIWTFRLDSKYALWSVLFLFILSALFTSISLRGVGEVLMRLSLLGWMIGVVQSISEKSKPS